MNKFIAFIILFSVLTSPHAFSAGAAVSVADEYGDDRELYIHVCGTEKELREYIEFNGPITEKGWANAIAGRENVLDILKNGSRAFARISKQKNTIPEIFKMNPLTLACGSIIGASEIIEASGCYDITKRIVVKDNGGIKACRELKRRLPSQRQHR